MVWSLIYRAPGVCNEKQSETQALAVRVLLKSAAMRWMRGICVIAVVLLALPAMAHPVPFSYLDVQLQRSSIDVSLTVHIYDLAHDLQITPMERLLDAGFLATQDEAIRRLLTPR